MEWLLVMIRNMSYVFLSYYAVLLPCTFLLYYLLPIQVRYCALLAGSAVFYCLVMQSPWQIILLLLAAVFSYGSARFLPRKRPLLTISILIVLLPLLLSKTGDYIHSAGFSTFFDSLIWPIGLSFYTLQLIAYLVDVYRGKIQAEQNLFHFLLFATWFPQIIQGPIPRYEQLQKQLVEGRRLKDNAEHIRHGTYLITWGLFLKFMIADKLAPYVNRIYDAPWQYTGAVLLAGGIFYSMQLYADFLACTTLAQGVSLLFGIQIADNFHHPYLATSIQEFWRRWHISLSTWLRDYVYIPLGGNRKGKTRKYINLLMTFLVSGFWHGGSVKFLFWGLLHGLYQCVGAWTKKGREQLLENLQLNANSLPIRCWKRAVTFLLVMLAWIIFRAKTLREGLLMIAWIPLHWCLPNGTSDAKGWIDLGGLFGAKADRLQILAASLALLALLIVSVRQEKLEQRLDEETQGVRGNVAEGRLLERLEKRPLILRLILFAVIVLIITVFGSYGAGISASDFLYGEF